MTTRGLSVVLIAAVLIVLTPRESHAKGLYSFLSDLFSGARRIVSFAATGEGRLAARVGPESTSHYITRRRLLRDDFHLAHGGPMTETVQRAMRGGEVRSIRTYKALMKREMSRPIYVTPRVPDSVREAQRLLALPKRPTFKTTLIVPKDAFPPPTPVPPLSRWLRRTLPGGGLERSVPGTRIVPVQVVSIQRLKK
jgi:hypothetical protein